jgi:hypothetical protein
LSNQECATLASLRMPVAAPPADPRRPHEAVPAATAGATTASWAAAHVPTRRVDAALAVSEAGSSSLKVGAQVHP